MGWHKLKVTVNGGHGEVRGHATFSYLRPMRRRPHDWSSQNGPAAALSRRRSITPASFSWACKPGNAPAAEATAPIVYKITVPPSSLLLLPGQDKLSFDVISDSAIGGACRWDEAIAHRQAST